MRLERIDESQDLYESSMSRILSHLETNDVATITAFVTGDTEARPTTKKARSNNKNKAENKKLSKDLQKVGYSFTRVVGEYSQRDQDEPVSEISYFVICPKGYTNDMFTKDMINLARKYEQEAVVIWNHLEHEAVLYGTDDFVRYVPWETFDNFKIDDIESSVWTRHRSHKLTFTEDAEYELMDVRDFESDQEATAPIYRISHIRKEMFGEWY